MKRAPKWKLGLFEAHDFPEIAHGEWVQPVRKGYGMGCCDCGVVHRIDFRLVKDSAGHMHIQFRSFRDEDGTVALRARDKKKGLNNDH